MGQGSLNTLSYVARGADVLVTHIWWEVPAGAAGGDFDLRPSPVVSDPPHSITVTATLGQNDLASADQCQTSGGNGEASAAWRQLGFPYQNVPTSSIGRRHFYKAAWSLASSTNSSSFVLKANGARVTLAVSVLSNWMEGEEAEGTLGGFEYPDPVEPAATLAQSAVANISALEAEHLAWWDAYWRRSSIQLPHFPLLETQWYGSLYVLASSHRMDGSKAAVAPGIVWPITNDRPAFRGAMTMNYNQQSLYVKPV